MHTYICLYREVCLSSRGSCLGGFVRGFCLEGFVRGGFCPFPLLPEYICCNRKLNITFNYRFHMYEQNLKSLKSHALGPPPPCHKLSHLLGPPPPPSSVTYFMDGPKIGDSSPLSYFTSGCRPFNSIVVLYCQVSSTSDKVP